MKVSNATTTEQVSAAVHDSANAVVCYDNDVSGIRELWCTPISVSSTAITVDSSSAEARIHSPPAQLLPSVPYTTSSYCMTVIDS